MTNQELNEKEFIEPREYFEILKASVKTAEEEKLKNQLETIAQNIISASDTGQKAFAQKLSFHYSCIHREQILLANGFNKYVYREDIQSYIDKCIIKENNKTTPLVKIIDLENYQRVIPEENMEMLKHAQSLKVKEHDKEVPIFDGYVVVFTDLSGEMMLPEQDKNFKARNRDPIIFGYFSIREGALVHDRFYFITDWEDEDCDLTFEKLMENMQDAGYNNPEKTISYDLNYLNEVVNNHLAEVKKVKNYDNYIDGVKKHNSSVWNKIVSKIKGIF